MLSGGGGEHPLEAREGTFKPPGFLQPWAMCSNFHTQSLVWSRCFRMSGSYEANPARAWYKLNNHI